MYSNSTFAPFISFDLISTFASSVLSNVYSFSPSLVVTFALLKYLCTAKSNVSLFCSPISIFPTFALSTTISLVIADISLELLNIASEFLSSGTSDFLYVVVIYLSSSKSNAAYLGIDKALADVANKDTGEIPMHIRNAPAEGMKNEGYSVGYKYPHDFPGHFVEQQYLPDKMIDTKYYIADETEAKI